MKRILSLLCSIVAAISLSIPVLASSLDSEVSTAARFLQENGIMVGNQYGHTSLNSVPLRMYRTGPRCTSAIAPPCTMSTGMVMGATAPMTW